MYPIGDIIPAVFEMVSNTLYQKSPNGKRENKKIIKNSPNGGIKWRQRINLLL
jgi:hypothetical protein